MGIIGKNAIFYDNKNNKQYANILITEDKFIGINTFDEQSNPTGYMHICFEENNRFYLDTIYCYDRYRKSDIASIISNLAEYILKDYIGYIIRGEYKPGQLSTDIESNNHTQEELDTAARNFYEKNDYQVIEYNTYINNKDSYNFITEKDFYFAGIKKDKIVVKIIKEKKYPFVETDGIIYYTNYDYEEIKRI